MPLRLDFINATTGEVTTGGKIVFPELKPACEDGIWDMESHNGSTSTAFFINSSWFFLAQLKCNNTVVSTHLMEVNGLREPDPTIENKVRSYVSWNNTLPLKKWSIAWDWVCNIIVVFPDEETMKTYMVSDYDGQIRPQSDYDLSEKVVTSLGSIDFKK